jgi:hypothetical protein
MKRSFFKLANMLTSIIQQILEMIQNENPLIGFRKPKHATGKKWDNYLIV